MKLRVFGDVDAFLDRVAATLMAREAATSLLLGVALRLREGHRYGDEAPFLACAEDSGGIGVIAARTPPHNLLLHVERETDVVLECLAEHLTDVSKPLPGVHAERTSAERFARIWSRATGCSHELAMGQRLYRLTEVSFPSGVPGRFRLAEPDDADRLVAWTEAFVDEAVGEGPHPDAAALVERLLAGKALAVWDDGEAVSMASANRPTPNGIAINLVYTPPERRRCGYASACVAALSQRQLDEGKRFCTLFTDLANPTSNALYRRVGFRPVADFAEIRFVVA